MLEAVSRDESLASKLMDDFAQTKSFAADPLVLDDGDGVRVTDDQGRTYIFGLSGILTNSLGQGNNAVSDAMSNQARQRRGMLLSAPPWCVAVAPPLVITNDQLGEIVDNLDASLSTVEETLLPAKSRADHKRPLARAMA
jgi:adenosylmethionine-8-amino-7-oxononanoate aminotransferase